MCTTQLYSAYVALGSGGCSVGDETFSNFTTPSFTNSLGVATLTNDQILVTPSNAGATDSLSFSYETVTGAPMTITLSDNAQVFAFTFMYVASAGSGTTLSSLQMGSTFGNTTPGSVSATKNAQTAGGPIITSAVTDNGITNAFGTFSGPVTPVTNGTTPFNVLDAISLQAQSGMVSDAGFKNSFTLSPAGVPGSAPEPPASILIGSGLLLISGLVRKISRRRRAHA